MAARVVAPLLHDAGTDRGTHSSPSLLLRARVGTTDWLEMARCFSHCRFRALSEGDDLQDAFGRWWAPVVMTLWVSTPACYLLSAVLSPGVFFLFPVNSVFKPHPFVA